MAEVRLVIFGDPAPQGSKKVIRGRVIEVSSEKLKRWRRAIAEECQRVQSQNGTFFTDGVEVEVCFYVPRPKTVKRDAPTVPPDIDKLCRGLLDGIGQSEMVWGDDSQVLSLIASKVYADRREPGADVTIRNITIP